MGITFDKELQPCYNRYNYSGLSNVSETPYRKGEKNK